jgi:hypothetical protein
MSRHGYTLDFVSTERGPAGKGMKGFGQGAMHDIWWQEFSLTTKCCAIKKVTNLFALSGLSQSSQGLWYNVCVMICGWK